MKKEERKELIKELFQNNAKRIQKMINFLELNHHLNKEYQKKYTLSTISQQKIPVEKLWVLFVSALNSGPSNNLSNAGYSIEKFLEIMKPLENKDSITINEFLDCCNKHINEKEEHYSLKLNSINDFFTYTTSDKVFPGIGKKKCALFIRNLKIVQDESEKKIFSDSNLDFTNDCYIALDIVITYVLNKILKLPDKLSDNPEFEINQYYDFYTINKVFKCDEIFKYKSDFMIIEDLWFWGYFNQRTEVIQKANKQNKKNITERKFEFNDAKFISDSHNFPSDYIKNIIENKSKEFRNIVEQKGHELKRRM